MGSQISSALYSRGYWEAGLPQLGPVRPCQNQWYSGAGLQTWIWYPWYPTGCRAGWPADASQNGFTPDLDGWCRQRPPKGSTQGVTILGCTGPLRPVPLLASPSAESIQHMMNCGAAVQQNATPCSGSVSTQTISRGAAASKTKPRTTTEMSREAATCHTWIQKRQTRQLRCAMWPHQAVVVKQGAAPQ